MLKTSPPVRNVQLGEFSHTEPLRNSRPGQETESDPHATGLLVTFHRELRSRDEKKKTDS